MLEIERIMRLLETEFVGREIHYYEKISSTNTVAKQQARDDAREGTTIIAETQTQGKGRLNRPWISPKGGIWLSVILRPQITVEDALKITLATAVAVAKTLYNMFDLRAEIKWPNDVLVDNKKLCGILTETSSRKKNVDFVVVGIGLNANFDSKTLPEELQTVATTLKEVLKKEIDREKLICRLLKEIEDLYKTFKAKNFETLLNEWRAFAVFLGKKVEITNFKEKFEGVAVDVDDTGALLVKLADGTMRKVLSGDVTVRLV
ncbi:MAG: biotin--[acetyl-CoA-carboxylase] ligase [Candidatus Bathyarchaeia archaeon]|nr:biotin--[acetyl-CoA-carboxylase] ligase [Candidatus Bathyarchaeota archaeon A05DMB-4]MDH7594805.1 biotin--[acetyl-CoA-carboxylase] ligase [Candidatus Bathyarchaeota archaeon]